MSRKWGIVVEVVVEIRFRYVAFLGGCSAMQKLSVRRGKGLVSVGVVVWASVVVRGLESGMQHKSSY